MPNDPGLPLDQIGRLMILGGLVVVALGLVFMVASRVPVLGNLPGDFHWRGEGWSIHVPLATSLLVSVVLSVLLTLAFNVFGRR